MCDSLRITFFMLTVIMANIFKCILCMVNVSHLEKISFMLLSFVNIVLNMILLFVSYYAVRSHSSQPFIG